MPRVALHGPRQTGEPDIGNARGFFLINPPPPPPPSLAVRCCKLLAHPAFHNECGRNIQLLGLEVFFRADRSVFIFQGRPQR